MCETKTRICFLVVQDNYCLFNHNNSCYENTPIVYQAKDMCETKTQICFLVVQNKSCRFNHNNSCYENTPIIYQAIETNYGLLNHVKQLGQR